MTPKIIRSFKKRFGRQMDRIAKMVSRFKRLPKVKKQRAEKELMRDLKREERVIIRLQKRCTRMARRAA